MAGALAVPAFAQQTDTTSQSGTASQPAATQSQPADQQTAQCTASRPCHDRKEEESDDRQLPPRRGQRGRDRRAEIAERAADARVGVVLSTLFETGIGIAGALAAAARLPEPDAYAHGLATAGLLEHDLLATGLEIDAGWMRAPGGPGTGGLGIALDGRALERFAAESAEAAG